MRETTESADAKLELERIGVTGMTVAGVLEGAIARAEEAGAARTPKSVAGAAAAADEPISNASPAIVRAMECPR